MTAFCTSEERLILCMWIETFYFRYYTGLKENTRLSARWEEQEVANYSNDVMSFTRLQDYTVGTN